MGGIGDDGGVCGEGEIEDGEDKNEIKRLKLCSGVHRLLSRKRIT